MTNDPGRRLKEWMDQNALARKLAEEDRKKNPGNPANPLNVSGSLLAVGVLCAIVFVAVVLYIELG